MRSTASSSVDVSSTGLSCLFGPASNTPSRAGTSDSGFSNFSAAEFRAQHAFQDLRNFCMAFNKPLAAAKECISEADEDVLGAAGLLEAEAGDMMAKAQEVTLKLSLMSRDCLDLLQHFCVLNGAEDAKNALREAHQIISSVRKDAQAVRTRYIDLLEQVKYLDSCTAVTVDQVVISHHPEPVEEDDGLETHVPTTRPSPRQARTENLLRTAREHFDILCTTLEECSDFWLMLHEAELRIKKLEKEALNLCQEDFQLSSIGGSKRLEVFREALRCYCQEHCASGRSDFGAEASDTCSAREGGLHGRSYSGYLSTVSSSHSAPGIRPFPPGLLLQRPAGIPGVPEVPGVPQVPQVPGVSGVSGVPGAISGTLPGPGIHGVSGMLGNGAQTTWYL